MNRYLAFCGDKFRPKGGMEDFISDHDEFSDAMKATRLAMEAYPKTFFFSDIWSHVYDTVEKRIITYGFL